MDLWFCGLCLVGVHIKWFYLILWPEDLYISSYRGVWGSSQLLQTCWIHLVVCRIPWHALCPPHPKSQCWYTARTTVLLQTAGCPLRPAFLSDGFQWCCIFHRLVFWPGVAEGLLLDGSVFRDLGSAVCGGLLTYMASSEGATWLYSCWALATLRSGRHCNSGNRYLLLQKTLQFGRRSPLLHPRNVQVSVGQDQICLMGAQT